MKPQLTNLSVSCDKGKFQKNWGRIDHRGNFERFFSRSMAYNYIASYDEDSLRIEIAQQLDRIGSINDREKFDSVKEYLILCDEQMGFFKRKRLYESSNEENPNLVNFEDPDLIYLLSSTQDK